MSLRASLARRQMDYYVSNLTAFHRRTSPSGLKVLAILRRSTFSTASTAPTGGVLYHCRSKIGDTAVQRWAHATSLAKGRLFANTNITQASTMKPSVHLVNEVREIHRMTKPYGHSWARVPSEKFRKIYPRFLKLQIDTLPVESWRTLSPYKLWQCESKRI